MPTLIQCCQQYFHTSNLYEVLGVEPNIGENDRKHSVKIWTFLNYKLKYEIGRLKRKIEISPLLLFS